MPTVRDLLAGRIPPGEAFWRWLVMRGLVVNVACTVAALALVAAASDGVAWPLWLAAVLHLVAVPFNVICLLGVWRALDRHPADQREAALLRAASLGIFLIYLVL